MKLKLVFLDWQRDGESIYETVEGTALSLGDFHSGTTFDAEIELDDAQEAALEFALDEGAVPVFYVVREPGSNRNLHEDGWTGGQQETDETSA